MLNEHDLLLDVYNTVTDQSRWPGVLDRLAEAFDAVGCIVFDAERVGGSRRLVPSHISQGYAPDLVAHYVRNFHDQELANQDRLARRLAPDNRVEFFGADLRLPEERAIRDPRSIEWLAGLGIDRWAACFLDKDDHSRSRLSLQFTAKDKLGADARRALVDRIFPHVAKAFELGRPAAQLARMHRNLVDAMDKLRIGVCILDNQGRVVVSNKELDRQSDVHGIFRVSKDGRLHLRNATDDQRLNEFVAQIGAHGRFGARPRQEAIVTSTSGTDATFCIEIAPLESCDELGSRRIDGTAVFSLDASMPMRANPVAMRTAFGLTETEIELVAMLGDGKTNPEIAERRERSVATVNAQVKSILSKTNSSNRTQLVRLLSGFQSVITDGS